MVPWITLPSKGLWWSPCCHCSRWGCDGTLVAIALAMAMIAPSLALLLMRLWWCPCWRWPPLGLRRCHHWGLYCAPVASSSKVAVDEEGDILTCSLSKNTYIHYNTWALCDVALWHISILVYIVWNTEIQMYFMLLLLNISKRDQCMIYTNSLVFFCGIFCVCFFFKAYSDVIVLTFHLPVPYKMITYITGMLHMFSKYQQHECCGV